MTLYLLLCQGGESYWLQDQELHPTLPGEGGVADVLSSRQQYIAAAISILGKVVDDRSCCSTTARTRASKGRSSITRTTCLAIVWKSEHASCAENETLRSSAARKGAR